MSAAPDPPLVVGLGGTTRKGSSSERALRVALAAAEAAGARTRTLTAHHLLLPHYEVGAAHTSDAEALIAAVRACDGLIVSVPGYHGTPSGLMKNALDYLEELRDDARPYLDGRAVGAIACAAGWQATVSTLASLRATIHALRGWPTPMGAALNSADGAFAADGTPSQRTRTALELVGRQVVAFAVARARA